MNNKDFAAALSARLELEPTEMRRLTDLVGTVFAETLESGDVMTIPNFGNFEVKKKLERVVMNPSTRQRMMVPPKLVLNFKPGQAMKERYK